jgi:hypothetical protein
MGKHLGFTATKLPEPMLGSPPMPPKPLVFPHGPTNQEAVEMPEDRVQGRRKESPEVLDPAPKNRIPHARQVVNGLVTPQRKSPAPHFLAHLLGRRVAGRWAEVHEVLSPAVLRSTRPERVPQEVELLASSTESVGELGLGKTSEFMI